jgi:hypothetical protein
MYVRPVALLDGELRIWNEVEEGLHEVEESGA